MASAKSTSSEVRRPIRKTFTAFVVAVSLVLISVIAVTNVLLNHNNRMDEYQRDQAGALQGLVAVGKPLLEAGGGTVLREVAIAAAESPSVGAVAYFDSKGELVATNDVPPHSGNLMFESVATAWKEKSEISHTMDGYNVVMRPVLSDGVVVGFVGAEFTSATISALFYRHLIWNAVLGLLALTLAGYASWIAATRATEPLMQMIDFTSKLSHRRLTARIRITSANEFETLAGAFNQLMARLNDTMSRVQRLAYMDPITELPNRERFNRELTEALSSLGKQDMLAVILLDIERFRWVNETLGPQRGDEALSVVGKRISHALQKADRAVRLAEAERAPSMVGRLGADEFAIVIPRLIAKEQAARILQLVVSAMRQPIKLGEHSVTLGLSGGVAIAPSDGDTPEDLIKNADLALKEAKREGSNRARFFTQRLNQAALDRLNLETEIRQGIEEDQFFPMFQPKVSFKTGKIIGAEALARWRRTNGEMISPALFIPMAEELGLINHIGESILRSACHHATRWMQDGHDCRVAVNVSPRQFENATFADMVLESLRQAGLPPGRLELEVTETMAVEDPERVSDIMRPLRAMGVRLAIDDFGAGHSNLGTLTKLPFDVFKIDQQFVRALHSDKQAPAIIEMILAMADALGLETVAEGVETVSQSDFLRRRGCTIAQGYLYSPPLPADEFSEFLSGWQPFGDPVDIMANGFQ